MTTDPDSFKFRCVLTSKMDYDETAIIGFEFQDANLELRREFIKFPIYETSMAEVGKAMEALGKYFQKPEGKFELPA